MELTDGRVLLFPTCSCRVVSAEAAIPLYFAVNRVNAGADARSERTSRAWSFDGVINDDELTLFYQSRVRATCPHPPAYLFGFFFATEKMATLWAPTPSVILRLVPGGKAFPASASGICRFPLLEKNQQPISIAAPQVRNPISQ